MWNKIFIVIFAVAVLAMLALTYLSYSQLKHIGFAPRDLVEGFKFYADVYWKFLWVSSLIILILSNVLLWLSRKSWALWSSFVFFAVFVVVQTWWLGRLLNDYEAANRLEVSPSYTQYFLGALLCIIALVIVFFNQFLILRMRERMHGDDKPTEEVLAVENPPDEDV